MHHQRLARLYHVFRRADELRPQILEPSSRHDASANSRKQLRVKQISSGTMMHGEPADIESPPDKENCSNNSNNNNSSSNNISNSNSSCQHHNNSSNNNNSNSNSNSSSNDAHNNQVTSSSSNININSATDVFVDTRRALGLGQVQGLASGPGSGLGQWPEQGQGLGLTVQYLTQQVMAAQQALHTERQEREKERQEREKERREREEEKRDREQERQEREEERRAAGDDAYNLWCTSMIRPLICLVILYDTPSDTLHLWYNNLLHFYFTLWYILLHAL